MLAPGTIVVGIRFRPASVPSVLSVPTRELVDLRIGSDELWGRRAVTLGDRLAASRTPREAAALLEAEIVSRLADASDPDPVATETVRLLMPGRMTEVGRLPGALHISESQLRRRCQVAIGFAPKVLHRMLRFQGFLALAKQRERPSREVGVLAAEAGYADQSHLTRESVRLTGRSPGTLLRESERHCQSSHDHGASYGPLLQPHALGRAGSNV
jgi:AraC-like DNA-binding protein